MALVFASSTRYHLDAQLQTRTSASISWWDMESRTWINFSELSSCGFVAAGMFLRAELTKLGHRSIFKREYPVELTRCAPPPTVVGYIYITRQVRAEVRPLHSMSFFQNAQNVDARYSTLNEAIGVQMKPSGQWPSEDTRPREGIRRTKPLNHQYSNHINGWSICVHPDGWRYYYSAGLVTDEEQIVNQPPPPTATSQHRSCGDCKEILLSTESENGRCQIMNTYVNHALWYASTDKEAEDCTNLAPDEEFNLRIEYWKFMYQHPSHRPLRPEAEEAAREFLVYIREGIEHQPSSRTPFSFEESGELLDFLNRCEEADQTFDIPDTSGFLSQSSAKTALISWILLNASEHNRTLYAKEDRKLGLWFIFVSLVCFGSFSSHREHITLARKSSELRVAAKIWHAYVDSLAKEWFLYTLAGILLLLVSVITSRLDEVPRFPALLSVLFTLGSVITSICFTWKHHNGERYDLSLVKTDFEQDALAAFLSIPFTSLIWAVISFLVAIFPYLLF